MTLIYSDTFGDSVLNSQGWTYQGAAPGFQTGAYSEHDGYLDLVRTGNGGTPNATLALAAPLSEATISYDINIHAVWNSYGGIYFSFIDAAGNAVNVGIAMVRTDYFEPPYTDLSQLVVPQINLDGVSGSVRAYSDVQTQDLLDRWVTQTVSFDSDTGLIRFDSDGDGVFDLVLQSNDLNGASLLDFTFYSGDWATGGYVRIDNLTVDGTPDRPDLKSTEEVLAEYGQLGLMAMLAQAAYHLQPWESQKPLQNDPNPAGTIAFSALAQDLQFLSILDLPDLAYEARENRWLGEGLLSGTYINKNAAATISRTADALFLSFRGTNDAAAASWLPIVKDTPDKKHWTAMDLHGALFEPLIAAISDYLMRNGEISKIFVTGHSLGAGMVEWFLMTHTLSSGGQRTFDGIVVESQTFASPGYYDGAVHFSDTNTFNLWVDGDTIEFGAILGDNDGDRNVIYHNIQGASGTDLHRMGLYLAFVDAMRAEQVFGQDLNNFGLHAIDYDRVYIHVEGHIAAADLTAENIGDGDDVIYGSVSDDIILGMDGSDVLYGGRGRDHIQGGLKADHLYGGDRGDFLYGGDEADALHGGYGTDTLTGGDGADAFFFYNAGNNPLAPLSASVSDVINDFEAGLDHIDLSLIDAVRFKAGDQAFDYLGLGNFSHKKGQIRWEWIDGNTIVEGDTDGNGSANFTITLIGEVSLLVGDFVL